MNIIDAICETLYNDYLRTLHNDWLVKIKCKYHFDNMYHTFIEYVYLNEDNNIEFLNDWWEGQDDFKSIDYVAIDNIQEFTNHILIKKKVK